MIRLVAATALAVMSLAACEGSDRPAAPAPAPAADQAAESASPAAPTVGNDVLTAEGLGQARIGMTLAELTAVWGADANPGAVGGADPQTCDEFHPAKAPQGVDVMIQNGVLTRITLMRNAATRTDRGIAVGDESAAVTRAYGDALVAQPHKYEAAPAEDLFAWTRGGSSQYVDDASARGRSLRGGFRRQGQDDPRRRPVDPAGRGLRLGRFGRRDPWRATGLAPAGIPLRIGVWRRAV